MVRDYSTYGQGGGGEPPAPGGLTRDWSAYSSADSWEKNRLPAWQTGGQSGTTESGFTTEFYNTMRAQRKAEADKIDADPTYVSKLYQNNDFTGIVTWDQQFEEGPEDKRKFNTGDVYENGVFRYNLYESPFTLEEANGILAPLVMGDDAGRAYKDSPTQELLRDRIQAQGRQEGNQVAAGFSARETEADVKRVKQDWDQDAGGWLDNAAVVAGQVALGAVQGLAFGPWGALGGAGVGLVGGLLNQDELLDMAARAAVKTEQGFEESEQVGVGAALQGWGGVLMNQGTLRSISHGLYDISSDGGIGDTESGWYQSQNRGMALDILDSVLLLGDTALLSASQPGRIAYQTAMLGGASGKAISLAGGKVYDDYSQSWETPENVAAAVASVGIDLGQVFVPSILARSARGFKTTAADEAGEATSYLAGRTFNVNAAGEVADRSLARRLVEGGASFLAPSTAIEWVGLRAAALRSTPAGGRITTQSLYDAASRLEQNPGIYGVLMNGFGEATEEVAQTVLDNLAVGYSDVGGMRDEIVNAALMGFAGGAGMTAGVAFDAKVTRNRDADSQELDRINTKRFLAGDSALTLKQMKALPEEERDRLGNVSQAEMRVITEGARRIARENKRVQAATSASLEVANDAILDLSARQKLKGSGVENMRAIVGVSDVRTGLEDAAWQSFKTTMDTINDRLKRSAEVLEQAQNALNVAEEGQTKTNLQVSIESMNRSIEIQSRIQAALQPLYQEFTGSGNEALIDQGNQILEDAYNGYLAGDNGVLPDKADENVKQEAGFIFHRSPADNPGSFPMVMLQIGKSLSRATPNAYGDLLTGDGVMHVSQTLEKVLTHDNDGDQGKFMMRAAPVNGISAKHLRRGDYLRSASTWNIGERSYEVDIREAVAQALTDPARDDYSAANDMLVNLETTFKTLFKGHIPDSVVEQVFGATYLDKKTGLRRRRIANGVPRVGLLGSGNDAWKSTFYTTLEKDWPRAIDDIGSQRIEVQLPQGDGTTITRVYEDRGAIFPIEAIIQTNFQAARIEKAGLNTGRMLFEQGYIPTTPDALAGRVEAEAANQASTFAIELQQNTMGSDMFRTESRIAYSPYNASTLEEKGWENDARLKNLIKIYTAINSGREQSQIDTLTQPGDPILQRARADLEALARVAYPDVPLETAIPQLATWNVADARFSEIRDRQPFWQERDPQRVSLFQFLLKNSAEEYRLSSNLPAEDQGSRPYYYMNLKPEQATNALIAALPVEEVVGRDLAIKYNMLGKSVAMVNAFYAGLGIDDRKAFRNTWRSDPATTKGKKGGFPYPTGEVITPWTILIDTITGTVDTQLSHGKDGHPQGSQADLNRGEYGETVRALGQVQNVLATASKQFRLGSLRDINKLRAEGPAHLRRLLKGNVELHKRILQMLPKTLQVSLPVNVDGETRDPIWIYELLLAKPEEAAMILFRETLLHKIAWDNSSMEDSVKDPTDPWIMAVRQIQAMGQIDLFEERLGAATNVLDFEAWVNQTFRQDQTPLLAYASDLFLSDLSSTRGGWSWISANSERREALRDLQQYANSRVGRLAPLAANFNKNNMYAGQIRNNVSLQAQLGNRMLAAIALRQPAIAPDSMQLTVTTLVEGLDDNAAKKNDVGTGVAAYGATEALMDGRLYGAVHEVASMERYSVFIDDLRSNPRRLLQPLRIQMEDGSTFEWNPLLPDGKPNVDQFLDLYTSFSGFFQPLMHQVFWPSMYSTDGEGNASLITKKSKQSLETFVKADYYKSLMRNNSFEASQEYLGFVQALSGTYEITELIAALMTERTGGSAAQQGKRENTYANAVIDVARAIKTVGELNIADLQGMRDQARSIALLSAANPINVRTEEVQESFKRATAAEAEAREALNKTTDPVERDMIQLQIYIAQEQMRATTAEEYLLAQTKIDWNNPDQVTLQKANLNYELNMHFSRISVMSDAATFAAVVKWARDQDSLTNDDWDALSKGVLSMWRAQEWKVDPDTINNGSMFANESYVFFGRGDRSYLTDMVLNAAEAAIEYREIARPGQPADPSSQTIDDILKYLKVDNLPPFSPDYILQHVGAREKLRAAAVKSQVDSVGAAFKRLEVQASSNRRSNRAPDPTTARTMVLTHAEAAGLGRLAEGFDGKPYLKDGVDVKLLQGATVMQIMVDYTVNGETRQEPLTYFTFDPTVEVDLEPGPVTYGTLDVNRLSTVVKAIRMPEGAVINSITIPYFHPADQPLTTEDANSLAYGGRIGEGNSDHADSLMYEAWFGTDAFNQQGFRAAMDARKNTKSAIQKLGEVIPASTTLTSDVETFIQNEAVEFLNINRGDDSLPMHYYRYAWKHVVDHMILVDEEGSKFTPYQIMQKTVEPVGNLDVVWLSDALLNTMRGGVSPWTLPGYVGKAPTYINNEIPWTGEYTEEQYALVPKLGNSTDSAAFKNQLAESRFASESNTSQAMFRSLGDVQRRRIAMQTRNRFRVERDKIQIDRSTNADNPWKRINQDNIGTIQNVLGRTANTKFLTSPITGVQMPPVDGSPNYQELVNKQTREELEKWLKDQHAQLWLLRLEDNAKDSRARGVITQETFREQGKLPVAPDLDPIIVDLTPLGDDIYGREWQAKTKEVMRELVKRRQPIIPASDIFDGIDESKNILLDLGYTTENGWLWTPADSESLFPNERVRDAAWLRNETISGVDSYLVTYGNFPVDASGGFFDERAELNGGTAYRPSVIATTGSNIFNAPKTEDAGASALKMLQQLDVPKGHLYLARQSILASDGDVNDQNLLAELAGVWARRLRKAVDTLDPSTGLPMENRETLDIGDIIVTMDSNQRTPRYRLVLVGHEPITDAEAEFQIGEKRPAEFPRVSVYSETLLTTDVASTPIGRIESWERDGKYGLRGKFYQPMAVVANKYINALSGYKSRMTDVSDSNVPVTEAKVLGAIHRGVFLNQRDAFKKGMTERVQLGAGNALSFWGMDFLPLLAEATTATYQDNNGNTVSIRDASEVAGLSNTQREQVRASVVTQLRADREDTRNERLYNGTEVAEAVREAIEGYANLTTPLSFEQMTNMPRGYKTGFTAQALSQVRASDIYYAGVKELLRHPSTDINQLLGVPGIAHLKPNENFSFVPSPAFSQMFEYDSLRTWVQKDINARQRPFNTVKKGKVTDGYELQPDWAVRVITTDDKGKTSEDYQYFQYVHLSPTGEDYSALVQHHEVTNSDDRASWQIASLGEHGAQLDTGYNVRSKKVQGAIDLAKKGSLDTPEGIAKVFDPRSAPLMKRQLNTRMHTPREQQARLRAARWARAVQPPLLRNNWLDETVYVQLQRDIINEMQFPNVKRYGYIVDQLVRLRLGALAERNGVGARSGPVSQQDAEREAAEILRLVRDKKWPIEGAAIPVIPGALLNTLISDSKWRPTDVTDMETAIHSLIGQFFFDGTDIVHPQFTPAIDGILHSYEFFLDLDLVSLSPKIREAFLDPETGDIVTTVDKKTQRYLTMEPVDADGIRNELFYYGGSWDTGIEAGEFPPAVGISKRRARENARRTSMDARPQQNMQGIMQGRKFSGAVTFSNRAFRTWHRLVAFNGMANPEIMLWSVAELFRNSVIENTTRLLTGTTIAQMSAQSKLRARTELLTPSNNPYVRALRGDARPYLAPGDRRLFQETAKELAGSAAFRTAVNAEAHHKIVEEGSNPVERGLDKALDVVGRLQDPASRVYMKARAQKYLAAIIRQLYTTNSKITPTEVMLMIHNNREWTIKNTLGLHDVGMRAIQRGRGFERTVPAAIYDATMGAAGNSANGLVNVSANLLKGFTMFQSFFWTTAMITTGTQGLNAIAAVLLQGNTSGRAFKRTLSFLSGGAKTPEESGINVMEQVLGNVNLAETMLRGQVSQMQLFMLGLALGSAGLTGEDDEERRRRKAQLSQGLGEWNDPMDIENDFRNYNALYFDNIPILSELFEVPNADGQPERSPAQLHWTLKLFLSPVQGMADFLDSGNPAYLIEGVTDAVGSLPFASVLSIDDASQTLMDLAAASSAAVDGATTPGEYADALDPLMKGIFLLERVTMENSFINSLYNGLDEYMRNPWVFAAIDDNGNVIVDKTGQPESSDALQYDMNATGETYENEIYRTSEEGALRGVVSQRYTLATMMNLLFSTAGTINSFNRYDMVPSELLQFKKSLGMADAETLILSVWDPRNNREVLTRDGADALFQSLAMGSVKVGDPALDGVFVDVPTRQAVMESLQTRIFIEGTEILGLTPEEADKRMNRIWWGDPSNPDAIPLNDVVWNRGEFAPEGAGISYSPTNRYRQLNTTWATGPDGKKWATGLRRGTLYAAFGVDPYEGSQAIESNSNLPTDGNLNTVDPFVDQNLGRRALTKVGSNWSIPSDQDIIDAMKESTDRVIDKLKDLTQPDYDDYYRRGGYMTGGGGGGGGRSYANNPLMPFLNGMKNPFADNVPQIYIQNVNVRRASIRRERFSSERGRLNNQQ